MTKESSVHDLLFISDAGEYHRLAAQSNGALRSSYVEAPVRPGLDSPGSRKVMSIARHGTSEAPRGPALALIPIKPEPAGSAACTCYLVNAENLNADNPWTSAAWSDASLVDTPVLQKSDAFEVLIAGPGGKVYHLQKTATDETPRVQKVDLAAEGEIWSQLRNGCIAGSAEYYNHPSNEPKVVPLVNVTTLATDPVA